MKEGRETPHLSVELHISLSHTHPQQKTLTGASSSDNGRTPLAIAVTYFHIKKGFFVQYGVYKTPILIIFFGFLCFLLRGGCFSYIVLLSRREVVVVVIDDHTAGEVKVHPNA